MDFKAALGDRGTEPEVLKEPLMAHVGDTLSTAAGASVFGSKLRLPSRDPEVHSSQRFLSNCLVSRSQLLTLGPKLNGSFLTSGFVVRSEFGFPPRKTRFIWTGLRGSCEQDLTGTTAGCPVSPPRGTNGPTVQ